MTDYSKLFINGAWVPSQGAGTIDVVNPATEVVIASVPSGSIADVEDAVSAARKAFEDWAQTPVRDRTQILRRIADGIERRRIELAQLITDEMGAPISFTTAMQVPLPINSFRAAADAADALEFEAINGNTVIVREPVGVVGAITPWNYPLHQLAAKVAYALAAGNTVVAKPSELAPLDSWILAEIITEAGLPAGVFNLVSGPGPTVGEAIAAHPDVDMVSFTGSTRAGMRVSELAAKTVKRVTLELGGKSPNVVLPDADLHAVIPSAVQLAYLNTGQTCAALTRLLVPRPKLAETEELIKKHVEALSVGNPRSPETALGPLVSTDQRTRVLNYIDQGIREGAKLVTGGPGTVPGVDSGFYVRPTVFSEVTADMVIHREEIFGPVLVIVPYDTESDAVRLANDTDYGLAGAVWSSDTAKARNVASRIRAGQIYVNGGAFNPNSPFGGYKRSGNGREYGRFGLEEFLEVKAIEI
jgi:aldehyde dehydrogenase (NAD+)